MPETKWTPRHALAKALTKAANNDGHSVAVLDAESGYSELYEALEAISTWELGAMAWNIPDMFNPAMANIHRALAKARGEA
jgi:hypothetical protein